MPNSNKTIKAIIIDDETRARSLLSTLLQEFCPEVEVLATCEDLPSGVKTIRKLKPDLVFLDIEMPGYSGLELLDFFNENEINFSIIFTTAYNQYAIQAFKLSAIDYLLKPIEIEALQQSVQLYIKKANSGGSENLKEKLQSFNSNKIAVPTSSGLKYLELESIVYLKADSSYTEVVLVDETKLIISRTLKNFEEVLENKFTFFRCHKSYMVNLSFITEYSKSDGGYLVLKGKYNVPLSTEKVAEFLDFPLSSVIKR